MKKYHFTGRRKALFLFSVLLTAGLVSCEENSKDLVKPKTVTDILAENEQFSILNDIVKGADASDAFRTENFTFFAPNNAAFQAADLTAPQVLAWKKDSVMSFLKYHVVRERLTISELKTQKYKTLNEQEIDLEKKADSTIVINKNANVIIRNVNTDSGIIQVINRVLTKK